MEIMEIVGKPTIFNNIEINTEVKYAIDLVDPTGKSSETLKFEGKIENMEMSELSYNNDSILTTNILIKLKTLKI